MKNNRVERFFVVLLIAAFVVASAVYVREKWFANGAEPATATVSEKVDSLNELKLKLTVNLDQETLDKMFLNFSRDFLDSSMPNKNGKRTVAASKVGWGNKGDRLYDAVSFPFSSVKANKKAYNKADLEAMYKDLQEEIMRNPVMGDMILQGMKELSLSDGTKVYDLNATWAKDFLKFYSQYGCGAFLTYHTQYWEKNGFELPHDGEDVEAWKQAHPNAPSYNAEDLNLVGGSKTPKLFVTEYYANTAKRILAWLERCNLEGVRTYATTKHFPLKNVEDANAVRTYLNKDKSYVDNEPALTFSVKLKDKKEFLFGFNIYDKRFEIFEPQKQIKKTKSKDKEPVPDKKKRKKDIPDPDPVPKDDPVPNPDRVPKPDPTPTPTPNPTPTPTPTPNPTPTPTPGPKDPSKDPVHRGNADVGGGEGKGTTPVNPVNDPSVSDMQNAHGGEDRNQGHSDPKTVTPTAPETIKDSGNKNEKVDKIDQNKLNYGEEKHQQQDSVTDKSNGKVAAPDKEPAGGEFSEPGL